MFDIWVRSDASGALEKYTERPFKTTDEARAWIKRYIPNAETRILERRASEDRSTNG